MTDSTHTPESQRERARELWKAIQVAARDFGQPFDCRAVALIEAFYQSAFTAGREAALDQAEGLLMARAVEHTSHGDEAWSWEAQECASAIARLRSEGGGNG